MALVGDRQNRREQDLLAPVRDIDVKSMVMIEGGCREITAISLQDGKELVMEKIELSLR